MAQDFGDMLVNRGQNVWFDIRLSRRFSRMSLNPREIPTGAVRYNTDSNKMEVYIGSTWMEVAVSSPNLDGGARGIVMGGTRAWSNH